MRLVRAMSRRHDEVAQRAGYATHSAYTRALIAAATPQPQPSTAERAETRRKALAEADNPKWPPMVRAEFRRIAEANRPTEEA